MSARVLLVACKCPHHKGVGKGDKIKMNEMGGAYDTWEKQEMQSIGRKTWRKEPAQKT